MIGCNQPMNLRLLVASQLFMTVLFQKRREVTGNSHLNNKTLVHDNKTKPCEIPNRKEQKLQTKMDPSELRMNLTSLRRIDPYIQGILMSSPQVSSLSHKSISRQ